MAAAWEPARPPRRTTAVGFASHGRRTRSSDPDHWLADVPLTSSPEKAFAALRSRSGIHSQQKINGLHNCNYDSLKLIYSHII